MGDSQTEAASIQSDIIRAMFSALDRPAYWLLGMVYQLFFNVASADLFANDTVMKFYGRVQLIIGVFMMFQLAMTIIKGIVNPDTFTDQKSGAGNIIYRIAVALVLLTILVPINIPNARNEYEAQINNNGLLFGTLYSLQHRLLENNTLGRLILGTNDVNTSNYVSTTNSRSENLKRASRIFTSTVLKGFYRINLLPEDQRPKHEDGKDDAVFNDNRVCPDIDDAILDAYTRVDAEPGEIISMVNVTCDSEAKPSFLGFISGIVSGLKKITGNSKYMFAYMPFISTIVAFVFVFILLSFTVDVAVRAVKLAVLRLIAPIPIISYMDPKGGKDNAFSSWVKTLTSTYLDLFIRLAVVYFVIFLIEDMIINGVVINEATGVLGVLSTIIIWIGLFIFAKQAPKFIKTVLGLKDDGGKLFGGFGEMLALGAAGAGVVGSTITGYRSARDENEALHPGSGFNGMRNFGSALAGAIGGGMTGVKAFSAKDATAKSVAQAYSQQNAQRASHSTFTGRVGSDMYGLFAGRSLATRDQEVHDSASKAFDALKKLKTTAEDEALKQSNYYGDYNGHRYNYQVLSAALQRARSAGNDTFTVSDSNGTIQTLRTDDLNENIMNDIKSAQAASYLRDQRNGVGYDGTTTTFNRNGTLLNQVANTDRAVHVAGFESAGDYTDPNTGVTTHYDAYDGSYSSVKKTMGRAADTTTRSDTNMRTIMNRANSQGKK